MRAEANSPKGARFLLRLPLMEPQPPSPALEGATASVFRGRFVNHILVVDDEAEIRNSLEEILREEGYGVATAATATEALVLLQDAPYDVVLLDIWLPDRDGLDVLADIHRLASNAPRSGHHQRPRLHRDRRQSHQARRLRLPGKAALTGAHADRAQKCGRGAATAHREPGIQAPVQRGLGADRRKRSRQGATPADSPDGADQRPRAHLRRVGHRQGTDRPRHSRRKPAQGPDLRRAELRRHPRGAHRGRALRLSPRRSARRTCRSNAAPWNAPMAGHFSSTKWAT